MAHLVANLALPPGAARVRRRSRYAGCSQRDPGIVRRSPYFGWRDVDLRSLLADAVEVPVIVDNDVNALTARERLDGPGAGVDDFAVVTVGRGVGLGLVLGGRQYRGSWGGAGEFGHVKIAAEGQCECGGVRVPRALTSDRPSLLLCPPLLVDPLTLQQRLPSPLGQRGGRGLPRARSAAGGRAWQPGQPAQPNQGPPRRRLWLLPTSSSHRFQSALRSAAIDEMTASFRSPSSPGGRGVGARRSQPRPLRPVPARVGSGHPRSGVPVVRPCGLTSLIEEIAMSRRPCTLLRVLQPSASPEWPRGGSANSAGKHAGRGVPRPIWQR